VQFRPDDPLSQVSKVEVNQDLRIAVGELFSAHYAAKRLSLFYSPEALRAFADAEVLRHAISLASALHDFFSPLGQRLEAAGAGPASGLRSGSPATPRVVVADDHPAMLHMVVALLQPEFQVVSTAGDGCAALAAIENHQPDLVVLDISMPVLGGIGVALRLREMGSPAKIVFLTAHQDDATLGAAREAGGLGYVLKASLATDLVLAMREALAGRSFVSPLEAGPSGITSQDPETA